MERDHPLRPGKALPDGPGDASLDVQDEITGVQPLRVRRLERLEQRLVLLERSLFWFGVAHAFLYAYLVVRVVGWS